MYKFDPRSGLEWERKQIRSKVFRNQEIDIIMFQEGKGIRRNFSDYSNPGFRLYAALINYYKRFEGELPPIEELRSIEGHSNIHPSTYEKSGLNLGLVEFHSYEQILNKKALAIVKDEIEIGNGEFLSELGMSIGIGSSNLPFSSVIEEEKFVIISMPKNLESKLVLRRGSKILGSVRKEVELELEEALMVIKTIFYYASGDKQVLEDMWMGVPLYDKSLCSELL